jgi:hypothetical protein
MKRIRDPEYIAEVERLLSSRPHPIGEVLSESDLEPAEAHACKARERIPDDQEAQPE